jgi:hypothetical protein
LEDVDLGVGPNLVQLQNVKALYISFVHSFWVFFWIVHSYIIALENIYRTTPHCTSSQKLDGALLLCRSVVGLLFDRFFNWKRPAVLNCWFHMVVFAS